MEIGPITGVRQLPEVKGRSSGRGQWSFFDLENPAHTDDETYTPDSGESGGGEEEEEDEFESSSTDSEVESKPEDQVLDSDGEQPPPVNFFA